MDAKLLFAFTFIFCLAIQTATADFGFQHYSVTDPDELKKLGLKCIPGRTTMKVMQLPSALQKLNNGSSTELTDGDQGPHEQEDHRQNQLEHDGPYQPEDEGPYQPEDQLRTHMTLPLDDDESCQICVCSTEGKDEYCSKRPVRNVNECIMISKLVEAREEDEPYKHRLSLAQMIRGGEDKEYYIWHYDEIPYEPDAKCRRGTTYYSNNPEANDTNLEMPDELESIIDYRDRSICLFCICSTDGNDIKCLNRDRGFCDYYRHIRDNDASRLLYAHMFQEDRPKYFRQLSYRIRRTMDKGVFDVLALGGDSLCCEHSNGHRSGLRKMVNERLKSLRRKLPKENLMGRLPQGDYVDFVVNNDK